MKRQAAEKRGLWGQVFGVVRIAAQGKKGTAFFDALRAKHVRCFGQQIEKNTVQGVIYAKDCKKMRKLAEQYGMVVTETPCKTLQFFLWRHRLRFGIPIGMILASCFLIYCCNVVMLIEVQGNTTISDEKICAVLEECGVKRGSFMGTVPFRRCEHQLRAAIPELCRVAMRHTGNRLVVEVTETPEEVAPLEKRVPCNIVSAYDAEITGVTVRSGQLLCAVKEPVQKGTLLVSGVQIDEEGNIRFRHAMADIEGIYQIEETFSCAYEQTIRTSSGREQTKTSLDFFTLELPLSKSQKPYAYGQTMTERTPLTIFGNSLPIAICQETNREYTETILQFTPEEAKQDLEQQIQRYERNFLTDVEILEKQVTDTEKETALCSTVSYTLKGEICVSKEILAKAEH